ncbi:hypothetical protein A5780_21675 [Nocardia sp. 852002-20019_SCH5090214]|jgi:hypothetical protein|uniref:Uncharacterized protein n=1 Tax=Nocardia nova TaxID=37330 RepID=A0A2S5ZV01_9NOCA|nr:MULTISPECIES: hypothetical protein [Nocardia]OBF76956.1 hypothetical protein A9X06_24080 [Mycobacterium sp. 852002-51759_SCH5129042]MBF6272467.1 hypothetical protein [Nocardia nova]MBV7702633.1 hypothetical protein [Nocardia nova]OBA40532.1 hypothetical protein A5789_17550 [Nocardia sp. 852002-51101_SCH5132738]OBA58116.1 hypothetical protein A5780_21675 [Nocardia sp. 852002-20019_SCH5090214]
MTYQPDRPSAADPAEQRRVDEKIAARMGISVEELHDIDRRVAEDIAARDAVPAEQRIVDDNPKFTKGFGLVTPENEIQPGEIREHYRNPGAASPTDEQPS